MGRGGTLSQCPRRRPSDFTWIGLTEDALPLACPALPLTTSPTRHRPADLHPWPLVGSPWPALRPALGLTALPLAEVGTCPVWTVPAFCLHHGTQDGRKRGPATD